MFFSRYTRSYTVSFLSWFFSYSWHDTFTFTRVCLRGRFNCYSIPKSIDNKWFWCGTASNIKGSKKTEKNVFVSCSKQKTKKERERDKERNRERERESRFEMKMWKLKLSNDFINKAWNADVFILQNNRVYMCI